MAIDITAANIYFGPAVHIRSEAWTRIPQARRVAAIAHAARLIASRLEDDLETDATVAGDFPRHDAAVFEQALWMIDSADLDAAIKDMVINPKQQGGSFAANVHSLKSPGCSLAPEALRHLVVNPRAVRCSRG